MSNLFVKLDEQTPSYICTWDSKSKVLQILSGGEVVKKYKELELGEVLHKIDKFEQKLHR